jgi:hypothetical protein
MSLPLVEATDKHDSSIPFEDLVQYPNNLTLGDLYYFMIVPTLCYELNFPRTSRIRKRVLMKRMLEVLIGFQVVFGLLQQWIIPSVKNSLITFSVNERMKRFYSLCVFDCFRCTCTENGNSTGHGTAIEVGYPQSLDLVDRILFIFPLIS